MVADDEADPLSLTDGAMTSRKRNFGAHILALLAAGAVIAVASAAWIVSLQMGPPLDGFVAGPMIIFVPMFLVVGTGLWLAVRAILHGRVRWRGWLVALVSAVVGFGLTLVYCGPSACFSGMGGTHGMMGWFVLIGTMLSALVHHVILELTSRVADA